MNSPTKDYQLILADPPWHFYNWSADAPGQIHSRARGANKYYPSVTLADLCTLSPPTDKNAVLLMWTISSHLPESLAVIQAWGFTYRAKAWIWLKQTKDGRPKMGMGYWTRQCTEDCLLATKGHPAAPLRRDVLALIEAAPSRKHSEKSEMQYELIDRLFPHLQPRLEMFARREREGWDVFGNEVEGSIQLSEEGILGPKTEITDNDIQRTVALDFDGVFNKFKG